VNGLQVKLPDPLAIDHGPYLSALTIGSPQLQFNKLYIGGHQMKNTMDCLFCAVVTNWEMCNKYKIKNALGQQVYFASEGQMTF